MYEPSAEETPVVMAQCIATAVRCDQSTSQHRIDPMHGPKFPSDIAAR